MFCNLLLMINYTCFSLTIEPTTSDQLIIIVIGGSIGCGVAVCIVISVVIGELPLALV